MKRKLVLFLSVLMGFAAMVGLAVQDEQRSKEEQYRKAVDAVKNLNLPNPLPQGVSNANWITLTANAGIALKTTSHGPGGKPAFAGTLMYRQTSNSPWQVLVLDNPVK